MAYVTAVALLLLLVLVPGVLLISLLRWRLPKTYLEGKGARNVTGRDLVSATLVVSVLLVLAWFMENGSSAAAVSYSVLVLGAQVIGLVSMARSKNNESE